MMTTIKNLMGTGTSGLAALATATGMLTNNFAATGNAQGNAALLPSDFVVVTTGAANTGVILPATCSPGDNYTVLNHAPAAASIIVYPPTGGFLKNGAMNAGVTLTNGQQAYITCIDPTHFGMTQG